MKNNLTKINILLFLTVFLFYSNRSIAQFGIQCPLKIDKEVYLDPGVNFSLGLRDFIELGDFDQTFLSFNLSYQLLSKDDYFHFGVSLDLPDLMIIKDKSFVITPNFGFQKYFAVIEGNFSMTTFEIGIALWFVDWSSSDSRNGLAFAIEIPSSVRLDEDMKRSDYELYTFKIGYRVDLD